MSMYVRFIPKNAVDLSWPPRVMGFDAEAHSFQLAKGYRAVIARITGIKLHDEINIDPGGVAAMAAALSAVARDSIRRDAAIYGKNDPVLCFVTRYGVPASWRTFLEWRLTSARMHADIQAIYTDQAFEQLVRMFKLYSAANSQLVGY